MKLRRLVVTTALAVSLPLDVAWAQPAAGDPVEDSAAMPPPPVAERPVTETPIPPGPRTAPPQPGFTGKGLLISAIAVTAFSWTSRLIATGVGAGSSCTDINGCLRVGQTVLAFTYMAPITQFIATGLVIPGALLKGRSDGWKYVTSGKPDRKGKAFIVAGAVVFGVFTATSIALRPAVLLGCFSVGLEGGTCGGTGGYVGYNLGVQASDTLSTVGAGLMTYGIAYSNYRKTHGASMSFAPFGGRGAYGLSVSGRF